MLSIYFMLKPYHPVQDRWFWEPFSKIYSKNYKILNSFSYWEAYVNEAATPGYDTKIDFINKETINFDKFKCFNMWNRTCHHRRNNYISFYETVVPLKWTSSCLENCYVYYNIFTDFESLDQVWIEVFNLHVTFWWAQSFPVSQFLMFLTSKKFLEVI